MMELDKFKDVHPDWHRLENLAAEEVPAVVNLLLAGIFVRRQVSASELVLLTETWERLPFVGRGFQGQSVGAHVAKTHARLTAILRDPDLFDDFLDEAATRLPEEETRRAVLRLLALMLNEGDLGMRQYDYFYAVALALEIPFDETEDILRLAWESYQDSLREELEMESFKPLVWGRYWSERTLFRPGPNPFSQALN